MPHSFSRSRSSLTRGGRAVRPVMTSSAVCTVRLYGETYRTSKGPRSFRRVPVARACVRPSGVSGTSTSRIGRPRWISCERLSSRCLRLSVARLSACRITARSEGHLETEDSATNAIPPRAAVVTESGLKPERMDSTRDAAPPGAIALLESRAPMQDAAEARHTFLVALNFAAVYTLWGSTYLAIRFGVQDLPPALLAGTRFLIAGTLLFSWLLLRGVPLPPRSLLPPIAVTGMLLLFCGNCLVTWAELTVPSGMAAVIVANLPFFVAAIEAGRKDGERLSGTGVLGLVIGFAGMLVLMWPKLASVE